MTEEIKLLLQRILFHANPERNWSAEDMQTSLEIIHALIEKQFPELEETTD